MAKKMKSLLFDDGYESFAVNDDPARIIRFNPADPEIINRVLDVQRHFKDYSPPENSATYAPSLSISLLGVPSGFSSMPSGGL